MSLTRQGINIQTNSILVALVISGTVGGLSFAAMYFGLDIIRRREARDAIDRGLRGKRDDIEVDDPKRGSLLVDLHCRTAESFLQFLEDYESGKVKKDLKEELLKIEIEVEELCIKMRNEKEVEEHKKKLR